MKLVSLAPPLAAILLATIAASPGSGRPTPVAGRSANAAGSAAAGTAAFSAAGPSLLVPAVPDSYPPESPPAPFLVPGRPIALDSTRTRQARARSFLALADQMERRGQLSTALAAYHSAIVLDTMPAGVAYRVGRIYQRLDDPERAAPWFVRELKLDPGNVEAALELGHSLAQIGHAAEAVAQLEKLKAGRPRDDRVWSALGFAYHAAGRTREAESAMRRALDLPPARASEHRDLGALLAAQGRDRDARVQYERAMALDPADAASWVNLGNLERRAGRNEAALAAYRAAEARDSSLALALQGQAQTLVALGRVREAEVAYRRWVELSPADFGARVEAIQFFVSEGRSDVALEISRGAVRADPQSGDARAMLGVALDAAGDKVGALAELRRAEALYTDEEGRRRAQKLIATLRAGAPDSLRARFAADSVEHEARR